MLNTLILFAGLALIVGMATGHIPLFGAIILGAVLAGILLGRTK